jgi:acyl dehydratase
LIESFPVSFKAKCREKGDEAMVDHKWIGRTYGPLTYEIGREKMKEYAYAAKDPRDVYVNEEVARQTKYGDIIAMPNFAATWGLRGAGLMFMDQEVSLNFLMLVHGAQEFEWFDVIRVGDVLTENGKIIDIYEKGNLDFVIYEATVTNQKDDVVLKATSTFIITGGGS